jgi:alkylation response protein AidB-like acyl-CoA dehydrogenase
MPLRADAHPLVRLPAAEQALLNRVRQLVAEHIGPDAERVGRDDVFAWDTFHLLAREGVIASAFPRAWGGSEASMLARVRIIEELASACTTAASLVTGTDLSSRPIVAGGSAALKDALLPDLAAGRTQSAFALTEPGAGSDVARLATQFEDAPDGGVRISGEKKFITRAGTADMLVVVARRAGGPEGAKGLSAFVVPRHSPGVQVSATVPKAGWNGVPIAMVRFDQVQVPASHRLGEEGRGMAIAQDTLLRARIGHAAIALGRMRGALQIATQYAVRRQVFGRAVGEHQGIQWMLAGMAATLESTRCLVYSTALRYDAGEADVGVHASIAKMQATDACMKLVVDALQLLGGNGYLKAYPLERFFRDAKMNQIGEGTSEVHKGLIGRHLLQQAAAMAQHPCLDLAPDLWCGDGEAAWA